MIFPGEYHSYTMAVTWDTRLSRIYISDIHLLVPISEAMKFYMIMPARIVTASSECMQQ